MESNPYELKAHVKAYEKIRKQRDYESWVLGLYVQSAIASTVGNMHAKRGHKKIEYLKQPLYVETEEQGLSEAEKKRYTENFFTQLKIMQANFELSKGS